jgi:hypothetical protein
MVRMMIPCEYSVVVVVVNVVVVVVVVNVVVVEVHKNEKRFFLH